MSAPAAPIRNFPPRSLIGGCAAMMAGNMFEFFEACEAMGPIVRARIFHKPLYIVTGPDLIEDVLLTQAKSFNKPLGLRALRWMFGTGLLTSNGELWKHRRRLIQPAFHARHQSAYAAELSDRIGTMLGRVRPGEADLHEHIVGVCLEQLMSRFFGSTTPALVGAVREAADSCHYATQTLMGNPWYYLVPSPVERKYSEPLRRLERELLALFRARRAKPPTRGDFADLLAHGRDHDGCPMRDAAVRDESITMILAGHETVAAAVTWGLYLLAKHPKVQTRLARELHEGCRGSVPSLEELPALPLLNQVLKETYRLYPPTHRIGRTAIEPVTLGQYALPARAELLISQWAVHRSQRHFQRPTEFLPERWTDEFETTLPRFAYFPFSAGPHVCVGQALATAEDLMLLGALVHRFEFALPRDWTSDPKPAEGLTLLPCRVKLRVQPRADASRDQSAVA